MTTRTVDTILKHHNSGNFTVSGCIKWLGEPVKLEHAPKLVRKTKTTDATWAVSLSVQDCHIQQIEEEKFSVTNCKLKNYFRKCLATTVNTAVSKLRRAGHLPCRAITEPTKLAVLSRNHERLSNYVSSMQQQRWPQKIMENPGPKILGCLHCNRATPLKNCYIEMKITFHPEKLDQHFLVIAFAKSGGVFLQKDIVQ